MIVCDRKWKGDFYMSKKRKRAGKRRQQRIRRMRISLLLVIGSILCLTGFALYQSLAEGRERSCVDAKAMGTEVEKEERKSAAETIWSLCSGKEDREKERLKKEYGELLILVNKEHAISKEYCPQLRKICKGRLQAAEVLYEDLTRMLQDAGEEGYQYYIASAYRSEEYQQNLINNDVKKLQNQGNSYQEALEQTYRQVMPAGYSEHETGLALDLLASGNSRLDITQETSPANRWLQEHCFEYGFILRYPRGKEEITGIDYEPWHFRYVGRKAARYLRERKLTLEEFWENDGE